MPLRRECCTGFTAAPAGRTPAVFKDALPGDAGLLRQADLDAYLPDGRDRRR